MTNPYLPSLTLDEYLNTIATVHPQLAAALDFDRPGAVQALAQLPVTEFDSDHNGRGDSYRRAQRDALVRWTGMRRLLGLATPSGDVGTPLVLDVLGGDGTIARAISSAPDSLEAKVSIVTGDLSGPMVDQALAQGLPAVRQAADFLFLRDGSMDGVVLAYGTHHIAPAQRPAAVAEAVRVTRPGGRVVLHDFDEASPMAGFFRDVVHHHAAGGHAYTHFTRAELASLFGQHGSDWEILDVYDPFVVRADTEDAAKARMCDYIADMYGVRSYFAELGETEAVWQALLRHFDHGSYPSTVEHQAPARPVVYRDRQFVAEVPRVAIVGVGRRGRDGWRKPVRTAP